MAKHWNPEGDLARMREVRAKPRWPEGATAGLVLIAAGCLGLAVLLYQVAGPKDVFGP
jgi:hypothetical protein